MHTPLLQIPIPVKFMFSGSILGKELNVKSSDWPAHCSHSSIYVGQTETKLEGTNERWHINTCITFISLLSMSTMHAWMTMMMICKYFAEFLSLSFSGGLCQQNSQVHGWRGEKHLIILSHSFNEQKYLSKLRCFTNLIIIVLITH